MELMIQREMHAPGKSQEMLLPPKTLLQTAVEYSEVSLIHAEMSETLITMELIIADRTLLGMVTQCPMFTMMYCK
jgi:hypothetical protein